MFREISGRKRFYFLFFIFLLLLCPFAGNSGRPTHIIKAQQPKEQRYPFLSVCAVFSCVQTCLTWAQMLMQAIAHGGCTDTVRESALKVDSGRKNRCPTGDSNPRQYCAWHFSQTLYPLSYCRPLIPADDFNCRHL